MQHVTVRRPHILPYCFVCCRFCLTVSVGSVHTFVPTEGPRQVSSLLGCGPVSEGVMKRFKRITQAWFVLLLFPSFSMGQAVYGNIIGTVADPSGATVANAPVTVTDIDRGTKYESTTNASGNYEQTHLLAGRYKVTINAPGFSPFEVTADVQIDASTRVDAKLALKGESPQVQVTAETPLLKTDR